MAARFSEVHGEERVITDEMEILTSLGLNKFLDPSNLVDAVMDRRNNPRRDIEAPW